ncbi:MAG: EAL domain-containing protein [Betaproteobacteria bacterium]
MKRTGKHIARDAAGVNPGSALRARAEQALRSRGALLSPEARPQSLEEAQRELQELQIHEIELEMQNEELRRAQASLDHERARYADLYDLAPVGYCSLDADGLIGQCNFQAAAMLGLPRHKLVGQRIYRFILPKDQDIFYLLRSQIDKTGQAQPGELRMVKGDGKPFWVSMAANATRDEADSTVLRVVLSDISERKQAEESLRLVASVFTHTREGIMIASVDGRIIEVNDAFTRITGYGRAEAIGANPRLLNSGRQEKAFFAQMWRDLMEKGHWYGEVWNRRKNGEIYPQFQTISAVRDQQGKVAQYVALFSDITLIKEQERQLEHIAHYDALTGLPNRALLADRLHQAMAQAQRHEHSLAVVFLDLDGFKSINDRYGHEAGDKLLIALAERMKQTLRDGDSLARLGGDEFVAVLLDLADLAATVPTFSRLLAAAAQPVTVGDLSLQVSASMGVSFYPQGQALDADELVSQADQAMYQAKLDGKNRYHVFDAEQDPSVRGHHESIDRIRRALSNQELVLHYQPKVNMRTGVVVGAEALIRWQHPQRGLLLPAVFLPVVEHHPLAVAIGEWVLETALAQMELWRASGLDIHVSVNVGARQLLQVDFVQRLRALLAAHPGVRPGDLELEVLETSALEDVAQASRIIAQCRAVGVCFTLDDFGTGYSSLSYLKRLPVTMLKLDQSFVHHMLNDPDDLSILGGVLGLASAFRLDVIAEGVETVEQGTMLMQLGCDLAQGYGIAPPMPAQDLPGWAAAWRQDPAWVDLPVVRRDDLPLLFASVEYRAWTQALQSYLNGEREAPPPLDQQQSEFGHWLRREGLTRNGVHASVAGIDALHRRANALAQELTQLQTQGHTQAALAKLGQIEQLRDALVEQLKTMVQTSRQ